MAYFDKLPSLDKTGWNSAARTQTIPLGRNALIGLMDGSDLQVASSDTTVCVIHEEPAPTIKGVRLFLLTPLQDGDVDIAAKNTAGLNLATMKVQITGKSGVRMVFFPGELTTQNLYGRPVTLGTIYVIGLQGQKLSAAAGPAGMPKGGMAVPGQGGHTRESTPAGRYVLGKREHVTTSGWPGSVVPWGAQLRLDLKGNVEYQSSQNGPWRTATGSNGLVTHALELMHKRNHESVDPATLSAEARAFFFDEHNKLSPTYQENDFGLWGWNLMQNGTRTAYFLHTTPGNERNYVTTTLRNLDNSHGCVHLVPKERDELMKAGALKEGVPFEVRPYSEKNPF